MATDTTASGQGSAQPRRRWGWVATLLAIAAALAGAKFGFDFGNRLGGLWFGALLALNSAVFCSIMAGGLADRLLRWRSG